MSLIDLKLKLAKIVKKLFSCSNIRTKDMKTDEECCFSFRGIDEKKEIFQ